MVYKRVFSRTSNWTSFDVFQRPSFCAVLIFFQKCYQSIDVKNRHKYVVLWLIISLLIQLPILTNSQAASTISNRSLQEKGIGKRDVQSATISPGTQAKILGFRLEGDPKNVYTTDERYIIKADHEVTMHLFVNNFPQKKFFIAFSSFSPGSRKDGSCAAEKNFEAILLDDSTAVAKIELSANSKPYHLCFSVDNDKFLYASSHPNVLFQIKSDAPMLPMWIHITLLIILLSMSGLFSGLNLGLMALDKNELQVIERCGTEDEKYFAKTISPVRKRGNYLLCTLLLGNVLVNSTLTILLDDLTSGIFAVIGSTLSIVIFGEIIPQALCSRHGLAVGAKTVYITYLFMFLTFPLSYPISKLLDKILGEEIGSVYDRERLMEYIRVTKDYNKLGVDEMNIISGALKFKKITVSDIMTPINDVFMLPYDTILNFDTLTLINNSGYSRIPVYEGSRDNVVGLLHVKDLSLIDPDHNLPLKVLLDFYHHDLLYVYNDFTLDQTLNLFKEGKSHMALVRRIINNQINDPYYELLGVVTLEDVIEELIQAEINDETDVISDNRRKQKRQCVQSRSNYIDFIRDGFRQKNLNCGSMDLENTVDISPQLALAAFRFLVSSVGPFGPENISEEVLKVLMAKNIYFEARGEPYKPKIDEMSTENVLYKRGTPVDYFIMILEGKARIIVTKENQEYDAGPFYYFGVGALTNPNADEQNRSFNQEGESISQKSSNQNISQSTESVFVPDYTLVCLEKVVYLKITKEMYAMALKTTNIERVRSGDLQKSLKSPPPKLRRISMGPNLPESTMIRITNDLDGDHEKKDLEFNSITKNKSNDNVRFKSSPVMQRSDAIELPLTGNSLPPSYGSIESLESDPRAKLLGGGQDAVEKKSKINGSLSKLNEDKITSNKHHNYHQSQEDEEEKTTFI